MTSSFFRNHVMENVRTLLFFGSKFDTKASSKIRKNNQCRHDCMTTRLIPATPMLSTTSHSINSPHKIIFHINTSAMKFCIVLFSLAVHSTSSFQQRISHGHRGRKGSSTNRRHDWHLQQSTSVQTIRRPLPTVPKERTKRFVDEDYQAYTKVAARSGSRLSSTIECKQKQLPFHTRVAKVCPF